MGSFDWGFFIATNGEYSIIAIDLYYKKAAYCINRTRSLYVLFKKRGGVFY
jgi:hypothetical protein